MQNTICKIKNILFNLKLSRVNTPDIIVKCGEWDTRQENEPKDHQTRQAKHVTIHPSFKRKGVHNDIAIVHLNKSFKLDEHINPVCLPASKVCYVVASIKFQSKRTIIECSFYKQLSK